MPNINQNSYVDSYTHDNNNRKNGGSRVTVRDYSNDNDDNYSNNNQPRMKKNTRNNRNSSFDDDEDFNVTNTRHINRNINKKRSNIDNDDDEDDDDTYTIRNNNRYTTRNTRPMSYAGPAVIDSTNIDDDFIPPNRGNQTPRRNSVASAALSSIVASTQNLQPVNYEELMMQRQQSLEIQRELLQKKMDEYYPVTFIITYSFIFIVICITIISLQIAMIVFEVALANIASGIWCGVYFLIAVGLALSTVFHRQYSLMHASLVMHFFGMFLAIGGIVIVNIVAITRFNFCGSLWFNQMCANRSLEGSHIAMIVFGCICFLLCVVFFTYIQCTVFSNSPVGRNDPYGYLNNSLYNRRPSVLNSSFRNNQSF
jgi:hypothetical protein